MEKQFADLYQPVFASRVGPAPAVIRAIITPNNTGLVEGVPQSSQKAEAYVLLSLLPEDLRRRVEMAVQLAAGIR